MVQAIMDGRKTQTRRVVKDRATLACLESNVTNGIENLCPYGNPGDRLWVREAWSSANEHGIYYKADMPNPEIWKGHWKPSIHMPKSAARIWLEVISVRAEILQHISVEDAIAEGVESSYSVNRNPGLQYKDYSKQYDSVLSAKYSFRTLWESINGPESWNIVTWVWVVEFRVIAKPLPK